jgi:hypothetical protein
MSDELERRPDAQDARPVPTGDDRGTLPPERVRAMFDRIARPYDTMNRVMTAGLDRQWRRLAADAAAWARARPCSTRAAAPATSRSSWRAASVRAAK